jgi:hypothetical protein
VCAVLAAACSRVAEARDSGVNIGLAVRVFIVVVDRPW